MGTHQPDIAASANVHPASAKGSTRQKNPKSSGISDSSRAFNYPNNNMYSRQKTTNDASPPRERIEPGYSKQRTQKPSQRQDQDEGMNGFDRMQQHFGNLAPFEHHVMPDPVPPPKPKARVQDHVMSRKPREPAPYSQDKYSSNNKYS